MTLDELKLQLFKEFGTKPKVSKQSDGIYVHADFLNFLCEKILFTYEELKKLKSLVEWDEVTEKVMKLKKEDIDK